MTKTFYNRDMAINFITGAPGSGKTAVTTEMLGRGYNVYDTDDPNITGMAGWHNLQTDEYIAGFNELPLTEDLLRTHVWRLTDRALSDFERRGAKELIYLCGRLREPESVIAISQKIVFLTVSAETLADRLRQRAATPGEVEWGREEWQIDRSIWVNEEIESQYRQMGAFMLDAEQPVRKVVDEVVRQTV
jgi:AAA domain